MPETYADTTLRHIQFTHQWPLPDCVLLAGDQTIHDRKTFDEVLNSFDVSAWVDGPGVGADNYTAVANAFAACAAAGGGTVYFPAGVWGNAVADWDVPDNCRVYLSAGATIKALPGIAAGTMLLRASGKTNVQIDGHGIIDGNKANLPTSGLFGVGIIGASSHVSVGGPKVINMPGTDAAGTNGGDGFYIGVSGGQSPDDVKILGVSVDGAVRNGITVAGGRRIRIIGPQIINVTGTNPGAGIDIEPNTTADAVDVLIDDFQIYNCERGIQVATTVGATSRVQIGDGVVNTTRGATNGHGLLLASVGATVTVGTVQLIDTKAHGLFASSCPNFAIGALTIRNPNVARQAGFYGARIAGATTVNWSIDKLSVELSSAHNGLVVENAAANGTVGIYKLIGNGYSTSALRLDESADCTFGVVDVSNTGNVGNGVLTLSTGTGCTGHTIGTLKAKGFQIGVKWDTSVADCTVGVANLKGNTTPISNLGTNCFVGNNGGPAYTIANLTIDRAYDADATTVDELADVLGTLVGDVAARGTVT